MERDPAAVLQAAIRGVVDRLPEAVKGETQDDVFKPSKSFVGVREGFYFGSGPSGTGYYIDPLAVVQRSSDSERAEKKALDAEELLREAEEQAGDQEVQLLDAKSLKRYVAAFERKYKENMEMRMKYADQPQKFMESEVDLDEEVQRLLVVASSPELYPDFVKSGALENLMALLSHDNTDIAADVLELFQQLTDADVIEDSQEEALVLVDSMLEQNGIELLVHRLTSLSDTTSDDEGKAVFNTLSIFENMIELKPEVAEMVLDRSKLLKWMLARLRPREFDSNKQYTAELLAILLQSSSKNQQRVADANGIDVLLQAIAPYKNRNPGSTDEEEYLENLFNSLCACLMSEETRSLFLRAEGIELMLLILKQKRLARAGALKALDFATTRSSANCERFVDQFGLKTIFAMFMGKAKLKRRRGEEAEEAEEEERALSVIANLFQGLARGSRRDRLAAKFVESEFEKCDRLLELYMRYHSRVQAAEAEMEDEDEETSSEERLLARMDEGLYSLQQCALIVGHLWFVGDMGIRKRILQLLHQKSLALANVREVLLEFWSSIGDEGSAAEAERERQRVKRMLTALGQEQVEQSRPDTTGSAQPPGAENGGSAAIKIPSTEANGMVQAGQGAVEEAEKASSPTHSGENHQPAATQERSAKFSDAKHRSDYSSKRHGDDDKKRDRKRGEDKHESKRHSKDDRDRERRHQDRDERRHRDDHGSRKEKRRYDDDDRRERKRDRR